MPPTSADARAAAAVTAVVGDGAENARGVVECAAALADALHRELALVQAQSTLALQAAALPQTRALALGSGQWEPFVPEDVERDWRAQAARLRALAGAIAARHGLRWSLHSRRGELATVARALLDETDALFIGAAPPPAHLHPARVLAVLDDGSASAGRALELAQRMAQAMTRSRRVRQLPVRAGEALDALLERPPFVDALVVPRAKLTPQQWLRLAQLGCPVLLLE
jgi:hypothetical protein